jgi:hypothetical protein
MGELVIRLELSSMALEAEVISGILGISPTKTWSRGDVIQKTKMLRKDAGWALIRNFPPETEWSEAIRQTLHAVLGKADMLKHLSTQHLLQVRCAYYGESQPAIYIEKNVLEMLASIGACLDIDVYT